MTREEYNAANIPGWHMVCHDADSAGATAIRLAAAPTVREGASNPKEGE
jgi:hypothetical protein